MTHLCKDSVSGSGTLTLQHDDSAGLCVYVLFFLININQKSISTVSRLSSHSTEDFLYFINKGNPVSCNCGLHLLTNIHEVMVFHRQISKISTLCNYASQTAIQHEK